MTLINNDFAQKQNLRKIDSSYTNQGVGGNIIHYKAGVDGFLWKIPLHRNTRKFHWLKKISDNVRKDQNNVV